MHHAVLRNDSRDDEEFYLALYDYYIVQCGHPHTMRGGCVPSPGRFVPVSRCTLTVRGTRENWTLHVVLKDSHEEFDLSPRVAHWWAWARGGLETPEVLTRHSASQSRSR